MGLKQRPTHVNQKFLYGPLWFLFRDRTFTTSPPRPSPPRPPGGVRRSLREERGCNAPDPLSTNNLAEVSIKIYLGSTGEKSNCRNRF